MAVLQLVGKGLKPLRMATDQELFTLKSKKLSPVMVAGFPLGVAALENNLVESSITLGNLRKFETFIQHSAPTCGGNSGGPILDEEGRVVGIVSYAFTSGQNLNGGVPISTVRRLMESLK